jgi:hypothetical protein
MYSLNNYLLNIPGSILSSVRKGMGFDDCFIISALE